MQIKEETAGRIQAVIFIIGKRLNTNFIIIITEIPCKNVTVLSF